MTKIKANDKVYVVVDKDGPHFDIKANMPPASIMKYVSKVTGDHMRDVSLRPLEELYATMTAHGALVHLADKTSEEYFESYDVQGIRRLYEERLHRRQEKLTNSYKIPSVNRQLYELKAPYREHFAYVQDYKCAICGNKFKYLQTKNAPSSEVASFDHVIPRSLGGELLGNVFLSHARCNLKKGDTEPTQKMIDTLQKINSRLGWDGTSYTLRSEIAQMMPIKAKQPSKSTKSFWRTKR